MIDDVYKIVENKYFSSNDFNGMPIYTLIDFLEIDPDEFKPLIREAIDREILTASFHGNTHIRAFKGISKENILADFDKLEFPGHTCLYPHENKLKTSSKLKDYVNSPYEAELAKGGGQLDFRIFDLSVLEYYRNDPRYTYKTNFIDGQICISSEYYESANIPEHDKIVLKTFGFAHDNELNRYVAVFLRYLSDLSPEHQKVWSAKEVKGDIVLHPDYYAAHIKGSFQTRMSIFEAFVQELEVINNMCSIIGKPPLFRNSFIKNIPKEFGFLLRPTESEFNSFIHLLDKMMSENLNKKFFAEDISIEVENERGDGKIVIEKKGTVSLLKEWVNKYISVSDRKHIDKMLSTFKEIRKLRQKPAHKVNTNSFNQDIFREQREIIINAYDAVNTLRLMLSDFPSVQKNPPEISKQLYEGRICDI